MIGGMRAQVDLPTYTTPPTPPLPYTSPPYTPGGYGDDEFDEYYMHADSRWALWCLLYALEPTAAFASDSLLRWLESGDEDVRRVALHLLSKLDPPTLAQHADAVLARLKDSDPLVCSHAFDALGHLDPQVLARHADAVAAIITDNEWARSRACKDPYDCARASAVRTLGKLTPAVLAKHADAVVTTLAPPDWLSGYSHADITATRTAALETLGKLDPPVLAQYADAVAKLLTNPSLEGSDAEKVQARAMDTLAKLEPAALARHADAIVAMRRDASERTRTWVWSTLRTLDPAAIAKYADDVMICILEEEDESVRLCAMETLCRLDGAALAQHARFFTRPLINCTRFRELALLALRDRLPHVITRGMDSEIEMALTGEDEDEFELVGLQIMARVRWYRLRLSLRVKRLALYWYALPYRPSGAGHARELEAWDGMFGDPGRRGASLKKRAAVDGDAATAQKKRRRLAGLDIHIGTYSRSRSCCLL